MTTSPPPGALPDGMAVGDLVLWTTPDGSVRCREVITLDEQGRPLLGPETDPP